MSEFYASVLIGYLVVREIIFHYSTHKLLNKLMSKNYAEYKVSSRALGPNQMPMTVNDLEPLEDVTL